MSRTMLLLLSVVAFHYVIFFSLLLTVLLGMFSLPIYIYLTLAALVGRVIFSREVCPLTTLENHYRSDLGLLPSKGFMLDYILKPKRTFKYLFKKRGD